MLETNSPKAKNRALFTSFTFTCLTVESTRCAYVIKLVIKILDVTLVYISMYVNIIGPRFLSPSLCLLMQLMPLDNFHLL